MRVDLLVAALATSLSVAALVPDRVEACSLSPEPAAHIFGSTSGSPGRRPWISLWNVKDSEAVTLSVVTVAPVAVTPSGEGCHPGLVCKGTPVAVDRHGKWLRPKADLPAGARVQVLVGGKLIGDTLIAKAAPAPLPAWNGIELVRIAPKSRSMCAPDGPAIELRVKPTKATLDNAVALFYVAKPDPKAPHVGIVMIEMLGAGADLSVENDYGNKWFAAGGPKELWVLLSDDNGNVGAPIKLI